ncbi:MAG: tetratricopeptide repeat protein [Planctomycetes bacterium]|nr:tetratricopeptide repeat protein [Planctomycetota bacterium]
MFRILPLLPVISLSILTSGCESLSDYQRKTVNHTIPEMLRSPEYLFMPTFMLVFPRETPTTKPPINVRYQSGMKYFENEDYEAAIPCFEAFLLDLKRDFHAYVVKLKLGECYLNQGDRELARETFMDVYSDEYSTNEQRGYAAYFAAKIDFELMDFENGAEVLWNAILKYPEGLEMPKAYLLLGKLRRYAGDGRATAAFLNVTSGYPDSPEAKVAQGYIEWGANLFSVLVARCDDSSDAVRLSRVLTRSGLYSEVSRETQRDGSIKFLVFCGRFNSASEAFEQRDSLAERVVNLKPGFPKIYP